MIIRIIHIFFIIIGFFILNVQTMIFTLFVFLLGYLSIFIFNKNDKNALEVFSISFNNTLIYLILCYAYMIIKNFDFLLSYDTIAVFIPNTNYYLSKGSFINGLESIWSEYSVFTREIPSYYTLLYIFGYISKNLNLNFYISLQLVTVLFSSLSNVLVYKIFLTNDFTQKESKKYAIIISLFSILFFYSIQILRDFPIAFLYLSAILIVLREYSFRNLILLFFIIIITSTFRIESGIFLVLFVPLYLYLNLFRFKYKIYIFIISIIVSIIILYILFSNFSIIKQILDDNKEYYIEGVEQSEGVLSLMQKVPIFGQLGSLIYNLLQPLPFWSKLNSDFNPSRPESYNIMNFPLLTSAIFNWFTIVFIIIGISIKRIRKKTFDSFKRNFKWIIFIGLFFLLYQSAVMNQRRIMAFLVILYILFLSIYKNMNKKNKKQVSIFVIITFIIIQLLSTFIYI